MLDKFWESVGSDLADKWLEYLFGPAFLFWAGGLGLYVWQTGWEAALDAVQQWTSVQQIAVIVAGLLTVVFSSLAMQSVRFSIIRVLEGYWPWPVNYLGKAIVWLRAKRLVKRRKRVRALSKLEQASRTDAQKEELSRKEIWLHWHPAKVRELLPTALGNVLRARERAPERKYGLEAVICWPRLWFLLPEQARQELINSREALDKRVEIWFWGALFLLWMLVTPRAALISVVWMLLSYGLALQSAMTYGDLFETSFDLYRMPLYDAVGWERPKDTKIERDKGLALTEYLWRGTLAAPVTFRAPQEGARPQD